MVQYETDNKKFKDKTIWDVWGKGQVIGANDPVLWRMDMCGAWIFRGHYMQRNSEYGWVIEYITPLDKQGTNEIANLIPVHCSNTMRRSNGGLDCKVIAEGNRNIQIKMKDYQFAA